VALVFMLIALPFSWRTLRTRRGRRRLVMRAAFEGAQGKMK